MIELDPSGEPTVLLQLRWDGTCYVFDGALPGFNPPMRLLPKDVLHLDGELNMAEPPPPGFLERDERWSAIVGAPVYRNTTTGETRIGEKEE